MTFLLISFLAFFSPDTSLGELPRVHKQIVMDIHKIRYIYPCKWSCSCNWKLVHYGWLVEYEGKQYQVEGERRDGKKNTTMFTDYTEIDGQNKIGTATK